MQAEINALPVFPEAARLPVNILGLTQIDDGGGNATIVTGRTIPWLQDTEEWKAWDSWQVTYRDVFILDAENRVVGIEILDVKRRLPEAQLKQIQFEVA